MIVLDTNVVLDWLVFRDSSSSSLAAAISQRQVHWVATAGMRNELDDVLRRGLAVARGVDPAVALATWDAPCHGHHWRAAAAQLGRVALRRPR